MYEPRRDKMIYRYQVLWLRERVAGRRGGGGGKPWKMPYKIQKLPHHLVHGAPSP